MYQSLEVNRMGRTAVLLVVWLGLSIPPVLGQFSLGVAAGESSSGVGEFWTRADEPGPVQLVVATDAGVTQTVAAIFATADQARDNTVLVQLAGLAPATDYYYQFRSGSAIGPFTDPQRTGDASFVSAVGRLRTAPPPDAAAAARFVFTGDSNFAFAPMTAMGLTARENADLFIWFGDTIYSDVSAAGLGRARTLADYRAKYRQMFGDAGVQAALAATTLLVGWDDHEVANDYAGNDPALDREQQTAGYTAFFEYMPIRPQNVAGEPFRLYRRIPYGANAEFFLLDARQYRDASAEGVCGGSLDPLGALSGPILRDPACIDELDADRSMLGREQLDWLKQSLLDSTASLKFVINNVPMSFIGVFPYDRWDGYDRERRELLEFIDQNCIVGVVVLTTDIHASAYNPDLAHYFRVHRPDYRLRNGIVVREVIVGPIGNATARQSIAGIGASFFGGGDLVEAAVGESTDQAAADGRSALLDGLVGFFENSLVLANNLDFIELNRLSYVVIDMHPDGGATLTWRGITPEESQAGATTPATIFETQIPPNPSPGSAALPCFAPVLLVVSGLMSAICGRRSASERFTG
ncbi:MAG: alkaline phosphatase D family protein [Phycisphaerales bacterium]|nr:alkaline phosphatase D family protein [Phycisphaerales bacterium]